MCTRWLCFIAIPFARFESQTILHAADMAAGYCLWSFASVYFCLSFFLFFSSNSNWVAHLS